MPSEKQINRYESLIQDVLNQTIRLEIENPIAKKAEVTYVTLTKDLSYAKIYISCLEKTEINKVLDALKIVKGFLKTKIAKTLNTYKCPELQFYIDETIDRADKIEELFKIINKKG